MKKCKYVHASKREELERVIQELQHQVKKDTKYIEHTSASSNGQREQKMAKTIIRFHCTDIINFINEPRTYVERILCGVVCCFAFLSVQLIRDDLRASTGGGGEGSEWWRGGGEEGRGRTAGEEEQEEAQMNSLEDYVELLYEGKDKVRCTCSRREILHDFHHSSTAAACSWVT